MAARAGGPSRPMKNLEQMLRELARPGVTEFAVVSERLPCVKIDGKYEPVDDSARSTDAILALLASVGGSRYVNELAERPAAWTTRVDGLGSVAVQAVLRDGRLQARFVLVNKAAVNAAPGPVAPAAEPPPARVHVPPVEEPGGSGSDPILRAAVVKPVNARPVPAITSLDAALAAGREAGASDLHLVAGRPLLLRLAGELVAHGAPIDEATVQKWIEPVVPERMRAVLTEHGSCDFALERGDHGRYRANVARQRSGLKACLRSIPGTVPTLASLGLPADIEKATHHHQGLVLVTGPTGHGKTSTLAAIVDIINAGTTHHIITVEDPVEYVHPRKKAMISQREVGSHTRSFASALKAALREDPDVIVVGELRDTETVRMALAASETGHLVVGTMNTPSAAKTIDRLIDLFPPGDQQQVRMTLAGGLHLIVSQRLVPAADGQSMVAAAELLPGSVALWSLIRDAKTYQIPSLQQRGKGFGIVRLDDSLLDLARAGRITQATATAQAENPDELEGILSGKRAPAGAAPAPKPEASTGLLGKAGQLFGKRGG